MYEWFSISTVLLSSTGHEVVFLKYSQEIIIAAMFHYECDLDGAAIEIMPNVCTAIRLKFDITINETVMM